jgi:hypothetical protein
LTSTKLIDCTDLTLRFGLKKAMASNELLPEERFRRAQSHRSNFRCPWEIALSGNGIYQALGSN